jgi:hypothetical protein
MVETSASLPPGDFALATWLFQITRASLAALLTMLKSALDGRERALQG